jgi:hypothetical protein
MHPLRIANANKEELADFLIGIAVTMTEGRESERAAFVLAVDGVLERDDTWEKLRACETFEAELATLEGLVRDEFLREQKPSYVAQGRGRFVILWDRVEETAKRVGSGPAYAMSQVLAELRPRLDSLLEQFFGDVFTYLQNRVPSAGARVRSLIDAGHPLDPAIVDALSTLAGPIPQRLVTALFRAEGMKKEKGEPLVVISHSMGGQVTYDVVSYFLPALKAELAERDVLASEVAWPRVDFWCATASQVGLFEELGLFLASDHETYGRGHPIPKPSEFLGKWWNVWDHNDVLSYSVAGIFEGVDDEAYDSGLSLLGAHAGYLERPSFYRDLANKLRRHQENGAKR